MTKHLSKRKRKGKMEGEEEGGGGRRTEGLDDEGGGGGEWKGKRRGGQRGRRDAARCAGTAYSPSSSGAEVGVFRRQGQPGLCVCKEDKKRSYSKLCCNYYKTADIFDSCTF